MDGPQGNACSGGRWNRYRGPGGTRGSELNLDPTLWFERRRPVDTRRSGRCADSRCGGIWISAGPSGFTSRPDGCVEIRVKTEGCRREAVGRRREAEACRLPIELRFGMEGKMKSLLLAMVVIGFLVVATA